MPNTVELLQLGRHSRICLILLSRHRSDRRNIEYHCDHNEPDNLILEAKNEGTPSLRNCLKDAKYIWFCLQQSVNPENSSCLHIQIFGATMIDLMYPIRSALMRHFIRTVHRRILCGLWSERWSLIVYLGRWFYIRIECWRWILSSMSANLLGNFYVTPSLAAFLGSSDLVVSVSVWFASLQWAISGRSKHIWKNTSELVLL